MSASARARSIATRAHTVQQLYTTVAREQCARVRAWARLRGHACACVCARACVGVYVFVCVRMRVSVCVCGRAREGATMSM